MTRNRKITLSLLVFVALLLIAWDVYAVVWGSDGDTISESFLWLSSHPELPFGFGVLSGHLLWPQRA